MKTRVVRVLLAAGLLSFGVPARAQTSGGKGPTLRNGLALLEVPAIEVPSLLARDKALSATFEKILRFAEPFPVRAKNGDYGLWEIRADGRARWTLYVRGPDATDLNLGFSHVSLPPGCVLRLVSADSLYTVGPYTQNDVGESGQLWTPLVPGELLLLEADMPLEVAEQFALEVGQVNRGYRNLLHKGLPASGLLVDKSGTCNVDVVCAAAAAWSNQIRSVGVYSIYGTFACSGTLLMNPRADFRPFFLTAAHCLDTAAEAASVVVYWNFQSPACGQLGGGSLTQYQSGASLRATYASSDFTLLELYSVPGPAFKVHYAGWDRTGDGTGASACIHHPNCDEKAFTYDNESLASTAYYSTTVDANANHWRVLDWDVGTTEPGSSGSGLWRASNQRIRGQLHGGDAACGNDLSDWYGKLSSSWTGGGSSSSRLSDWLDPDGAGLTGMDGADPSGNIPPGNDQCSGAVTLSGGVTNVVDTGNATSTNDPTPGCGSGFGNGVWYKVTPTSAGTVTVRTCGSTFDTILAVYSGTCGALTPLVCDDNSAACGGNAAQAVFTGTAGATYYLLAGGAAGATGTLRISATVPLLANDLCGGAVALSSGVTNVMDTSNATSTGDPTPSCGSGVGKGVWYKVTPANSGTVTVDSCGSSFDTVVAVYSGSCASLTSVGCNDDSSPCGSYASRVVFTGAAGITYSILAGGYSGASGTLKIYAMLPQGAPEMDVRGNGVSIADGDSTPSLADHTDFGSAPVVSGTVVRTFTLTNSGAAALTLTGSPRVAVSGTHAAEFTVTTQPGTPVAAGGSTAFQVTFDPAGSGVRTAALSVANNDSNENPYNFSIQGAGLGFVLSTGAVTVVEGGSAGFTVRLNAAPGADVTATVSRTAGDADLTVSGGSSLTLTPVNWNVPQTVTVAAAEDADALNGTATITVSAAGLLDQAATATEADHDTAGVTVVQSGGATAVAEGGTGDTYTVVLNTRPGASVTIAIYAGAQLSVIPTNLSFTTTNWSSAQTVTVQAVDDAVSEGTHTGTITHAASSADSGYNGIAVANVTVSIADNDPQSLVVSTNAVTVREGSNAVFTVRLAAQPVSSVAVFAARSGGDPDLTVSAGSNLIFAATNWSAPQPVMLAAAEDADTSNGTATITVSSAGLTDQTVTATEADNDREGVLWYVATSGDDGADGTSWDRAKRTIQAAVDVALSGDTVLVSNGVYDAGGRVAHGALTNRVAIDKSIAVRSVHGPGVTAIRGSGPLGDDAVRCAYVGSDATLAGFLLTNGGTRTMGDVIEEQSGGGAWCEPAGVLSNCVLAGNAADYGGASYDGTLIDCTLSGNTALFGGGACLGTLRNCALSDNVAFADGGASYDGMLIGCALSGNTASYGGGANQGTLTNCTLSGNAAADSGGGAYYSTLHHCTLSGNTASVFGGGAGYGALDNCVLSGNAAADSGGGAYYSTLSHCTLSGNTASNAGGGAFFGTLNNCIIYYNTAAADANVGGASLIHSCAAPLAPGPGNLADAPGFVAANDYHLAPGSPCIDAGDNAYAQAATDRDGNPRIANSVTDMGAYEYREVGGYWAWASGITNGLTNYYDCAAGDGYPNLLKYATGSSPTNADNLASVSGMVWGAYYALRFHRNTGAVDVTYVVECTSHITNPASWYAFNTNVHGLGWADSARVSETGTGTPVTVTVQEPEEPAIGCRYLRLQVTRP